MAARATGMLSPSAVECATDEEGGGMTAGGAPPAAAPGASAGVAAAGVGAAAAPTGGAEGAIDWVGSKNDPALDALGSSEA